MFLRHSAVGREPLAVAMSGVRMGERLLQISADDTSVVGALAAKPGLSGESALVVADEQLAAKLRGSLASTGALVNISVQTSDSLPFPDASFDVIVVHNRENQLRKGSRKATATFGECLRVLRVGGRIVVLERGAPTGLGALFRPRSSGGSAEATRQDLESAGFRAVRLLAERDAYLFMEGLKS